MYPEHLSDFAKAHAWDKLLESAHSFIGSAQLGKPNYQHLGLVFTPGTKQPDIKARESLLIYARTHSKDPNNKAALFDSLMNSQVIRAAWKVENNGYYFEFWSHYAGVPKEKSNPDRLALVRHVAPEIIPGGPEI